MIFSIVIAIVIAVILLSNLELIGGFILLLLGLLALVVALFAVIGIVVYGMNNFDLSTENWILIFIIGLIVYWTCYWLYYIFKWLNSLRKPLKQFYDLKTKLQFLKIKFFTPGFTDDQKIIKIKKINTLSKYGDEQFRLLEGRKKQEEIEKYDKYFLKCKGTFKLLADLINSELSAYIEPGYISLDFVEPTRRKIKGIIVINVNDAKSIITIGVSKNGFKVSEYFYVRGSTSNITLDQSYSMTLTQTKRTVKTTKKFLIAYFKLHPEKLDS